MGFLSPEINAGESDRLAPWGRGPGRLWSLWDMIKQYAWQFFLLSQFLERMGKRLQDTSFAPTAVGGIVPNALLGPQSTLNSLSSLVPQIAQEYLNKEEQTDVIDILDLLIPTAQMVDSR